MTKLEELRQLEARITDDPTLPLRESTLVFGEGSAKAEVVFIGEAPGFHEDQQGRPFVGRAGKLLDKLIEGIHWRREDVYITNIVKRRPPENRDPLPEEIQAYKPYLEKQLEIIEPKVIVPLGRFSMMYFLPLGKISKDQGKIFWWREILVMPVYHPAAALRNGNLVGDLESAFAKLPKLVSKHNELLGKRTKPTAGPRPQKSPNRLL
ncbi:MAG: uracil-DNA glycosylase [bacterium]|nr:uracil-DNA glycosylase [bacterium]MDZ4231469.1 uracil-DNA glycosylase [Patescibacteria group bacterium]